MFAYEAIGLLASRMPHLFRWGPVLWFSLRSSCIVICICACTWFAQWPTLTSLCAREKIDMVVRLFSALKFEDQFLRLTIQDSITSLAGAYKVLKFRIHVYFTTFHLTSPNPLVGHHIILLDYCSPSSLTILLDHQPTTFHISTDHLSCFANCNIVAS